MTLWQQFKMEFSEERKKGQLRMDDYKIVEKIIQETELTNPKHTQF